MLNEIEEFNAYTGTVDYCTNGKYDSTYLGRFTYDMLLKFEGLARVLTVIARGYMFKNGTEPQIDVARPHSVHGAVFLIAKNASNPCEGSQKRTGNTKQIFRNTTTNFRSLLTITAVDGFIGTFIM